MKEDGSRGKVDSNCLKIIEKRPNIERFDVTMDALEDGFQENLDDDPLSNVSLQLNYPFSF